MEKSSERRILIVIPNDSLGGAEGILKMIALHFKDEIVVVKFLTKKRASGWEGVNLNIQLSYSWYNSEYLGALGLILSSIFKKRKERYNYIFTSHVFVTGLIGILIRLRLIKKVFFIGRESTLIFRRFRGLKLFLYKSMYKFGYSSVNLLICQTDNMKEELINALPYLKEKTKLVVIPNPIDLNEISEKSVLQIPKEYGRFIVSAGRLIPEKGFDLLINCFKQLKSEHNKLKLIILGEGNERQHLENLIKKNNLEGEAILEGFVPNVYPYFKAAELCVVSSRVEGFPNVLLQMMSQNTKVVSTKCAGGIDGIEGIYISDVNNEEKLLNTIRNALAVDTQDNRRVFDLYLKERSIEKFVYYIENEISR